MVEKEHRVGYKLTKAGWIPEDWSFQKLGSITSKITVGIATEVRPSVRKEGVPLIRNQNIRAGHFDDTDIIYISPEFDLKNKNRRVKLSDVIIVRTGSNVGQACVVPANFNNAQTFTTLIVSPKRDLLSDYLALHINSYGISEIERLSAGAGKPNLNAGFLKEYRISLPSFLEQYEIATCISVWYQAIKTITQLIKQKEELKKGLMQQLLTGKKRLQGFNGNWSINKLKEYFTERKETGVVNLPLLSVGEAGVYPQSESNKKDTSNNDKSKYKRICKGDIGYNTMRMWQGRSALSSLEGIVSPAYTIVTPKENADDCFFAYLFKLPEVIHKFFRYSQGLVGDTLNCKYKDFSIVKVNLPPTIDEQKAIAQVLQTSDKEIKTLNQKLEFLKDQKKGMMQQLLTGKKRLQL